MMADHMRGKAPASYRVMAGHMRGKAPASYRVMADHMTEEGQGACIISGDMFDIMSIPWVRL